jgi:adenylyltransferase/sulfurtransferase
VIGCGALGSIAIETLARAGVGRLRLVDRDIVEPTNLHRQILYTEADAAQGLPKAVAAERRVRVINSEVAVEGLIEDVTALNVVQLIRDVDVVVDATDNFETRYLLNDAACREGVPWVYGAVVAGAGLTLTILPGRTPCLRCVFPEMPEPGVGQTCDTAGVILPAVAAIASIQAVEALKILIDRVDLLHGKLIQYDIWEARYSALALDGLRERGECPVCDRRQYEHLEAGGQIATSLCGRGAIQVSASRDTSVDLEELAARLRQVGEVAVNPFVLRFRTGEIEMMIFPNARSIIKGVTDTGVARGLYARYVGV